MLDPSCRPLPGRRPPAAAVLEVRQIAIRRLAVALPGPLVGDDLDGAPPLLVQQVVYGARRARSGVAPDMPPRPPATTADGHNGPDEQDQDDRAAELVERHDGYYAEPVTGVPDAASYLWMAAAYQLTTSIWLPRPRSEVFAFFADAHNLQHITPGFLSFRVLTPAPIVMRAGATIDYRLNLRGLPLSWKTEITVWDPPTRFVDVQRRGPYAEWIHTHSFEDAGEGTLVRDHVRYRLYGPFPLARLVNVLLVAPDTRRIFEYRQGALEQHFNAAGRARRGPVIIAGLHSRVEPA
jgi:ligand-binding SRPBCC domain-containing protein